MKSLKVMSFLIFCVFFTNKILSASFSLSRPKLPGKNLEIKAQESKKELADFWIKKQIQDVSMLRSCSENFMDAMYAEIKEVESPLEEEMNKNLGNDEAIEQIFKSYIEASRKIILTREESVTKMLEKFPEEICRRDESILKNCDMIKHFFKNFLKKMLNDLGEIGVIKIVEKADILQQLERKKITLQYMIAQNFSDSTVIAELENCNDIVHIFANIKTNTIINKSYVMSFFNNFTARCDTIQNAFNVYQNQKRKAGVFGVLLTGFYVLNFKNASWSSLKFLTTSLGSSFIGYKLSRSIAAKSFIQNNPIVIPQSIVHPPIKFASDENPLIDKLKLQSIIPEAIARPRIAFAGAQKR